MEIQKVAIVGLGALGTMFGHQLSKHMPKENLRVIADERRIAKYSTEGVYSNGERCDFQFVTPESQTEPADLVLVAVKYLNLQDAMRAMKNQVGENTIIMSLLNGITSERILAETYSEENIVNCVAYGMDAVREGNRLTYQNMGRLSIGAIGGKPQAERVQRVARFFEATGFPYEVDANMAKRMWGKFMLNVGVNQTVALFGPNYGAIQHPGHQRDTMIGAMREVMNLSQPEGVHLTQADLDYWLGVLVTLNPEGKPSMRQDIEAKRPSEVALFAGAVLALSHQHGLQAPINQMLQDGILKIEASY